MLIHFVHLGDAYLPELQAYVAFLQATGHQAQVHHQIASLPSDATVLWWMCGQVGPELAQRYPSAFQIHEYASASVPPLARLKDRVKRWQQAVPDYRIYQNQWVRERMGFDDALPYELRDMGVSPAFFAPPTVATEAEFDFVYLGEMRRLRHFLPVFDALAQTGRSVLLIGQLSDALRQRLPRQLNVSVTGRVPHEQIPMLLRRARYGLNLVPDQQPYTEQTSTKLLEYCAAGLQVVSTNYPWVRQFEQRYDARFAYLPWRADAAAYDTALGQALNQQFLRTPDVRSLAWPALLAQLQIWRELGMGA